LFELASVKWIYDEYTSVIQYSESFTFISTLGSQNTENSFYAAGLPGSYLCSECLSSLQPALICIPALSLHSWFVIGVDGGSMGEQVTNFNTHHS
jgi:hypothetical protein